MDADAGVLVTELTDGVRKYYASEHRRLAGREKVLQQFARRPAASADGHRIEIAANIGLVAEAGAAFAAGPRASDCFAPR